MNNKCANIVRKVVIVTLLIAGTHLAASDADSPETSKKGTDRPVITRKTTDRPLVLKDESQTPELIKQLSTWLLIIAGLGTACWVVYRKLYPRQTVPGGRSRIEIIEKKPIGPKRQLVLVRIGTRNILLADAGGNVNMLCDAGEETDFTRILDEEMEADD